MDVSEDRLQAGLEALEAGRPESDVLRGMTEDEGALLALAASLRSVEWPEGDKKSLDAGRKRVLAAYHQQVEARRPKTFLADWFKDWRAVGVIYAGAMVLVVGIIVLIGLNTLQMPAQLAAATDLPRPTEVVIAQVEPTPSRVIEVVQQATATAVEVEKGPVKHALLANPRGLVEILNGADWLAAQDGNLLEAGARLRTGTLSSVALLFEDGSYVQLGPNSEMVVKSVNISLDGAGREIVLQQVVGQSEHRVAALEAGASHYQVNTPAGIAVAQGTAFHVRVNEGRTALYVSEGAVEIFGIDGSVLVDAGQMTAVTLDARPEPPTQFTTGMGEVTYIGDSWIIAGQTFATHEQTLVMGNPLEGDIVLYEGRVLENQTLMADLIVLVRRNPSNAFSLTGTVDLISDMVWKVNGQPLVISDGTEIEAGIEAGDLVYAQGSILPGGFLQAASIQRMQDQPGTPFDFAGVLQQSGANAWVVNDVPITTAAGTAIDPDLAAGELVRVKGWILEDGAWLASSIQRVQDATSRFEFTGRIESMAPWLVAGAAIETRSWTMIDEGLAAGDLARVKGQIMEDGAWVAFEISAFGETLTSTLVGRVFNMNPWVVSGFALNVDADTVISNGIGIGMLVRVETVFLPDGTQRVARIDRLGDYAWSQGCTTLVVKVIGLKNNVITLEGWPALPLDGSIKMPVQPLPGSIVQVTICYNEDMTVKVVAIVILHQPEIIVEPTPLPPPPAPPAEDEESKVTMCHNPDSKNPITIEVDESAVQAHLDQGDILGPCP